MKKTRIEISIDRCTGCRACETACSFRYAGQYNPALSRIRVLSQQSICLSVPSVCMHCDDAPCAAACPEGALYREKEMDTVVLREDDCVGCGLCVGACPYGAMHLDEADEIAYKCELCAGDPECIKVCAPGALRLVTGFQIDPAHQKAVMTAIAQQLTSHG
jgi:carbon-monoxide dehydrogenase iron sulfur subunit